MPLDVLRQVSIEGTKTFPYWNIIKKYGLWVVGLIISKIYFSGIRNKDEIDMHGKVVMITGGTSGIGQEIVHELAKKGTQLILLVRDTNDLWLAEYIEDLRRSYDNQLIYAETCDLSDLNSIRKFATKWIDNLPPRRLDAVICCAGVALPIGTNRKYTKDSLEEQFGINYAANFQLLSILLPALKSQPLGRDVRVILLNCSLSYIFGQFNIDDIEFTKRGYPKYFPLRAYGSSKIALRLFASELQRRLIKSPKKEDTEKVDANLANAAENIILARVITVDPGLTRSPMAQRFLSFGSLWGLLFYLLTWSFWWLVLKSPLQAAQSVLYAIMSPMVLEAGGDLSIKECQLVQPIKFDPKFTDVNLQEKLWKNTQELLKAAEKRTVLKRKAAK